MAIEDEDAAADTAALAQDHLQRDRAWTNLASYRRALTAAWSLAPRHRMGFIFWFSSTEQVLRYHRVPPAAVEEIRRMEATFKALQAQSAEAEASWSLWAVFWPTIWRAAFWMVMARPAGLCFTVHFAA